MKKICHWLCILLSISGSVTAQSSSYKEQTVNFFYKGHEIHGRLIRPDIAGKKLPLIIFVHGSGPEDYSSSDNYRYLWEMFTSIGFACYSWDRPGVGDSEGKWYEASIDDRAEEVIEATKALKVIDGIDSSRMGYWGISQAGWVIPKVAARLKPAFVITVSSPVTSAFDQELYRVRSEMHAADFSERDVREAIAYCAGFLELIQEGKPYVDFAALQEATASASWADYVIRGDEVVYAYLTKVLTHDDPPDLTTLQCPTLAIWGANDLMVPPDLGAATYTKVLKQGNNKEVLIKIIPDADHTLTYNVNGTAAATIKRRQDFKENQKEVFAPGYIDMMLEWLRHLSFSE